MAASNTPALASASAHARLPVTSSSKRRRSNGNETPKSNAAGSGAESKRPDHNGLDMLSLSSDNLRAALQQPHPNRAGHLLRRRVDVGIEAGAQRIEPLAAIDRFDVGGRDGRIEALLRFRRDIAPELGVREMQHDGGRRFVKRARAAAVRFHLDAIETADAVFAGDRLEA